MSLRLPRHLSTQLSFETGASVLDAELLAETASALGRAGELVRRRLDAFAADPAPELRDDAAEAVWGFLIQRELCGLKDRQQVIADYAIPKSVMARLGVSRRTP